MKYLIFCFLIALIACSDQNNIQQNAFLTPHKPEWFGASEQKVVERFGQPTEVLSDTLNGKKFIYARINRLTVNNINFNTNQLKKIYATNEIDELIVFRFNSLNTVCNSYFYFSEKHDISYIYPKNRIQ
ncbi:MAG: hypothetical protein ACOVO1_11925 [Chitinophagaceae bacterium]